jgi:hypothetical protein
MLLVHLNRPSASLQCQDLLEHSDSPRRWVRSQILLAHNQEGLPWRRGLLIHQDRFLPLLQNRILLGRLHNRPWLIHSVKVQHQQRTRSRRAGHVRILLGCLLANRSPALLPQLSLLPLLVFLRQQHNETLSEMFHSPYKEACQG